MGVTTGIHACEQVGGARTYGRARGAWVAPVNYPGRTLAIALWLAGCPHTAKGADAGRASRGSEGCCPLAREPPTTEQVTDLACRVAIHELINKATTAGDPHVDSPGLG